MVSLDRPLIYQPFKVCAVSHLKILLCQQVVYVTHFLWEVLNIFHIQFLNHLELIYLAFFFKLSHCQHCSHYCSKWLDQSIITMLHVSVLPSRTACLLWPTVCLTGMHIKAPVVDQLTPAMHPPFSSVPFWPVYSNLCYKCFLLWDCVLTELFCLSYCFTYICSHLLFMLPILYHN